VPYSLRFERKARKQLDDTCQESGETVCKRLWNWLNSIKNLAEYDQLNSMSMPFVEFLERLSEEVDGEVPVPELLSPWKKQSFLKKLRGILHLITRRENPFQIRVVREDIRFFNVTMDIYVVLEINRVQEDIIIRKFIGLPIDG